MDKAVLDCPKCIQPFQMYIACSPRFWYLHLLMVVHILLRNNSFVGNFGRIAYLVCSAFCYFKSTFCFLFFFWLLNVVSQISSAVLAEIKSCNFIGDTAWARSYYFAVLVMKHFCRCADLVLFSFFLPTSLKTATV